MAFDWGSIDWGSVAGAAASMYGADKTSGAAKKAGEQVAAGADKAIDLSRDIYNDQRNLNMPAYNAGNAARDQYMRMLGLPVGASSAPAQGGLGATQAGSSTPTQWFGDNARVPTVNAQLYASDPIYRRAWDETAAIHQRNFGKGYTDDSNRSILQQNMQNLYGQYAPQQQAPATQAQSAPQDLSSIYDQFRNTPGYQFGLQEGNRSVEASAAARGGLNSGATLKALQKFGTNYADQQGYRPYMNDLSNLFGGGQVAASNIGSAGSNYGQQAGNAYQNAANARGQSTYASGQAWANGMDNAAGFLGDWYGNTYGKKNGGGG